YGHGLGLSDAMSSIAGMSFDRRVPPGVELDHVVCRGQVQAEPSSLQADQKQRCTTGSKRGDARLALSARTRAVQVLVAYSLLVEPFADKLQKIYELAEDQGSMPAIAQLFDQVDQRLQLCGVQAGIGKDQPRVTAKASEPRDLREHLQLVLALAVDGPELFVDLPPE